MLGRTHMAIGALGAVVAAQLAVHTSWVTIRTILSAHMTSVPSVVITECMLVTATVVGSLVPDLDQPDSQMARRVERIGKIVSFCIMVLMVFLLHLEVSVGAWLFVFVLGILASSRRNTSRMMGLGILAVFILSLGLYHQVPMFAVVLLAAWLAGAMFTAHRTFTHSLVGIALFGTGVLITMHGLSRLHITVVADGLLLGYGLHLVADAIAGGVPLLWPLPVRYGARFVRTDGPFDHLIGGIATLVFLGVAIW